MSRHGKGAHSHHADMTNHGKGTHFRHAETFQCDSVGSFPKGWSDAALLDPANPAPKPSAEVVRPRTRSDIRRRLWQLFAATTNVLAVIDLGLSVTLARWYGVDVDLDALTGNLHARITDATTGSMLDDTTVSLGEFGV